MHKLTIRTVLSVQYMLSVQYIRTYVHTVRPHIHMRTFGNLADLTYGAAAVVLRESPSLPLSYVHTVHTLCSLIFPSLLDESAYSMEDLAGEAAHSMKLATSLARASRRKLLKVMWVYDESY